MSKFVLVLILSLLAFGCSDINVPACFEQNNMAACADLCTGGDQKACAHHTEIGLQKCTRDNDLATCGHMCIMANSGKQVFCKHKDQLCLQPENKDNEDCI